jgi:hypothetical protein
MNEIGMSPKKAHEVSRMARYVLETIKVNRWDTAVLRIVDVGAGQVRTFSTIQLQEKVNRQLFRVI